jgi:3-methyladenine DNA glycosylase AlkC
MNLLTDTLKLKIKNTINTSIINQDVKKSSSSLSNILDDLYETIPDSKRISYGRYYTIKVLSQFLYEQLSLQHISSYNVATSLIDNIADVRVKSVCLGVLSFYGLEDEKNIEKIIPYFIKIASEDQWEVRENAAGLFQKIIKKYPDALKPYLQKFSTSKDPYIRRFTSETLRPVSENRWIQKNPNYSLSILQNMFKESVSYPRTSVGNNLSDLARKNPEIIYGTVKKLVDSGNKNSFWIAKRACRNLIKKEPLRVMNLLHIDEYKYKKNLYKKSDL